MNAVDSEARHRRFHAVSSTSLNVRHTYLTLALRIQGSPQRPVSPSFQIYCDNNRCGKILIVCYTTNCYMGLKPDGKIH